MKYQLPEPAWDTCGLFKDKDGYTAEQMQAAFDAGLEEAARTCTSMRRLINVNGQNERYAECAEFIRGLKGTM